MSTDMRRVLITATYFSSEVFLGSLRVNALVRHLPEHGWEPVVLTPALPTQPAVPREDVSIVEYADLRGVYARWKRAAGGDRRTHMDETGAAGQRSPLARRIANAVVEAGKRVIVPDPSIVWWPPGARAGRRVARTKRLDAVITSSNPPTPHLIGHSLRRDGVPWVADFRDLWVLNHYYPYGPLRRSLDTALERRTLRSADAIVTLSEDYLERLRPHYGFTPPSGYHAIPLGFDDALLDAPAEPLDEEFTIVFTGNFVEGKRDPRLLLEGVRLAVERGQVDRRRLRIMFWGPRYGWIDERAAEAGLADVVEQHGYVERDEALRRQRRAQLLALFLWDHPSEAGAYSGKMEFLAAGRPILVLTPPRGGIWERLPLETGAGTPVHDAEEIAGAVASAFTEYAAMGAARYAGSHEAIAKYTYSQIAAQFAAILDDVARP
jgi:glycosyltransferase involved in cell wall biosynthesis